MDFTLAVLTHGRGSTLSEALRSFREHVEPAPAKVLVYSDGGFVRGHDLRTKIGGDAVVTHYRFAGAPAGFCAATAALWQWAVEDAAGDWVFWLEHDFIFRQPVDLAHLAKVLAARRRDLAQMQLMRNAVSEAEHAAGGLFELRRSDYTARDSGHRRTWLEHRSYFTTNPSLMSRDFMQAHPFNGIGPHCEGRYGLDLVAAGYSYGVWGDGRPWVEHVGIRSGFGY